MGRLCACMLFVLSAAACSFDWNGFDPRASPGGGGGAGGMGGSEGGSGGSEGGAGADGGGGAGAAGGGGVGGSVPSCLLPITDDFSSLDMTKWFVYSEGACGAAIGNDELELTCAAGTTFRQSGIGSVERFDLTGCGIVVELTSPLAETGMNQELALFDDSGDAVYMSVNNGLLFMSATASGGSMTSGTTSLDPVAQRWWRVREEAGCFTWEVSPDGVAWTEEHMSCIGLSVTSISVVLALNLFDYPQAAKVAFDNVNQPP